MAFKLGKAPARLGAVTFQMKKYVNLSRLPTPPAEFGHYGVIQNYGVLGNAQFGDCVWAGAAHETMLWNKEAGRDVKFSTANVLSDYSAVTGFNRTDPNSDQGTDMQKAASYRLKTGVADANGNRHKIAAYLAIEVGNLDEMLVAAYVFGAAGIGVLVPESAQDQFEHEPWSVVPGSQIEGGHYVPLMGMRAGNFIFNTWGDVQPATPEWVTKYMDEGLLYLTEEFLLSGKSLEGFDLDQLQDDLNSFNPQPKGMIMSATGLPALINTIETDISDEWGAIVGAAEADATAAWNAVSPILLGILPAEWAILRNLIATGIADLESMSIEEVETALLNLAISEETQFILNLGSNILQAIIAVFKPSTPSASAKRASA